MISFALDINNDSVLNFDTVVGSCYAVLKSPGYVFHTESNHWIYPNSNYQTIIIMDDQDACYMSQLNFQQAQEFLAIETYVLGRER